MNFILFLFIPYLTHLEKASMQTDYDEAVLLAARTPPAPPPELEPERKEPPKEKEPPKPPPKPRTVSNEKRVPQKPRMQVTTSAIDFTLNMQLAQGMAVAPPPPAPAPSPPPLPEPPARNEFDISEVDTPPKVLRRIPPAYPFSAKRRRITGKVVVRFLVDVEGKVDNVKVLEAAPKGVFEDSVLSAINKWRFSPGVLEGKPVATWVTAPFEFTM